MSTDPGDITLATYEQAAQLYCAQTTSPSPVIGAFLDRFADLVGVGRVLELGSGPGHGADHLEQRGATVARTDGARAFVDLQRAAGHDARLLDIRSDDLGGPYDAVLADAVLLHLDRGQLEDLLRRARAAVVDGGVLACTLKEGDGAQWSEAKLGLPRHFTYWREAALREALGRTGWAVHSLEHVAGRLEPWLYVVARAA